MYNVRVRRLRVDSNIPSEVTSLTKTAEWTLCIKEPNAMAVSAKKGHLIHVVGCGIEILR
jgi:hypothetical protein